MSSHGRRLALFGCTLISATLAWGCGTLGNAHLKSTKAEERLVVATATDFERGRVKPKQVLCAEPSPDVATALSKATTISGGLEATAHVPNANVDASGSAAAALSLARAQTIAQMTNRLATIQLLRDALYRACEAYANGALSEITYAIMLSRYDKLMVTLLSGELVAGNFGQSLAVLGTAAGGSGDASASRGGQGAAGSNASASTNTSTTTAQAVGAIAGDHKAGVEVANALVNVQRKYIENINADPIIVACLTAFDRDEVASTGAGGTKQLVTYCQTALPQIVRLQADLLRARLIDGQTSLLQGCMAALDAASSPDTAVKATATALVDYCNKNFMTILKTQGEIIANQRALEEAQAAVQTRKLNGGAPK